MQQRSGNFLQQSGIFCAAGAKNWGKAGNYCREKRNSFHELLICCRICGTILRYNTQIMRGGAIGRKTAVFSAVAETQSAAQSFGSRCSGGLFRVLSAFGTFRAVRCFYPFSGLYLRRNSGGTASSLPESSGGGNSCLRSGSDSAFCAG